MKFLNIVLVIRFLVNAMRTKKDTRKENSVALMSGDIRHPAEFELR